VAEASLRELSPLATEANVALLFDFGSGLMMSLEPYGLTGEPTARDAVRDGATLTTMSGDKLLGGPQAGILIGRRDAVEACRRNPLARALRVDKLTLSALEATLALYREPERAVREIPALRMLTLPADRVRDRAMRLAAMLRSAGISCEVVEAESSVGGGAFPAARIPSFAISLSGNAMVFEEAARKATTPIVGRILDDHFLVHPRTIPEERDDEFALALTSALSAA
jgi:L-seryl-tRNA(Ser) seleniumtransferase